MKVKCHHCDGSGELVHTCEDHHLVRVEGHPLNETDYDAFSSRQGYVVKQCRICKCVFGIRWQYDAGTGSDNHVRDFGIGDPLELVKERHY